MTILNRLLPNKTTCMSLLLVILLACSTWLGRNLLTSTSSEKANRPDTPDAFMTAMHYTQFDEQGKWKSTFDARRMIHYSAQDTALFDKPRLISRDEHQETWIISANHSTNTHGGATVHLKDNVQVQRMDTTNQKNLDLTTTALTAYPKQHTMETDQPVTIVQPGSVINAVGMTANMQTSDIHLLSGAHGTYQESVAQNYKKPAPQPEAE